MKNTISITALICSLTLVSCVSPPPCETPVNGFLTGTSKQVKMGNTDAVNVFKQLDIAWANLDYEKMKTFIAEDAYLSFDDGFLATTPQEFIDKIKI